MSFETHTGTNPKQKQEDLDFEAELAKMNTKAEQEDWASLPHEGDDALEAAKAEDEQITVQGIAEAEQAIQESGHEKQPEVQAEKKFNPAQALLKAKNAIAEMLKSQQKIETTAAPTAEKKPNASLEDKVSYLQELRDKESSLQKKLNEIKALEEKSFSVGRLIKKVYNWSLSAEHKIENQLSEIQRELSEGFGEEIVTREKHKPSAVEQEKTQFPEVEYKPEPAHIVSGNVGPIGITDLPVSSSESRPHGRGAEAKQNRERAAMMDKEGMKGADDIAGGFEGSEQRDFKGETEWFAEGDTMAERQEIENLEDDPMALVDKDVSAIRDQQSLQQVADGLQLMNIEKQSIENQFENTGDITDYDSPKDVTNEQTALGKIREQIEISRKQTLANNPTLSADQLKASTVLEKITQSEATISESIKSQMTDYRSSNPDFAKLMLLKDLGRKINLFHNKQGELVAVLGSEKHPRMIASLDKVSTRLGRDIWTESMRLPLTFHNSASIERMKEGGNSGSKSKGAQVAANIESGGATDIAA
ncbi:MAG: hypothetical protein ABID45_00400 [Patescibacteria group bacterium]